MAARGVAVPSRVTQRKPLGEVNRVDARHQGSTKESLRVKASLANDRAAVVTKPHSQLAHKPKLQMRVNEQDKTKEEKTKQVRRKQFFLLQTSSPTISVCHLYQDIAIL